jgi:hypothetical protein
MLSRAVLAAVLVTGCYGPSVAPGAPCSEQGSCPGGQECRAGLCYLTGAPHDADESSDEADAFVVDAPPDGPPYYAWGTATELNSLESAGGGETDPSFTADLLTVVFSATVPTNDEQIYIATRAALTDTFTITELTTLNAVGSNDRSPEISADGKTLYFVSNRSGVYEMYTSTYTTDWSAPTIRTDLSVTGVEEDLALSPDGLTAALVVDGAQNTIRILTRANTTSVFSNPVLHPELEFDADIGAPTITNGGEVMYLQAATPRAIYRTTKKSDGTYNTPVPVAELNVAAMRTAAPCVTQSDEYMMFEVAGDIFQTSRDLP